MNEIYLDYESKLEYLNKLRKFMGSSFPAGSFRRLYSEGSLRLDGTSTWQAVVGPGESGLNYVIPFKKSGQGAVLEVGETRPIRFTRSRHALIQLGDELAACSSVGAGSRPRELPEQLIFEISDIGQTYLSVRLSAAGQKFRVRAGDFVFMDRLPNMLELEHQELRLKICSRAEDDCILNDIPIKYPQNYFVGAAAEKVVRLPSRTLQKFNVWDELMKAVLKADLPVDEAMLAITCCVYGGGWSSGSDPSRDLLHSRHFNLYAYQSSPEDSEHLLEMGYIHTVFMKCVQDSLRTLAEYKKLQLV